MPSNDIRKPTVTITAPGGTVSAEGIVLSASINSAPVANVILRRASNTVEAPLSKDTINRMRELQQLRFAARSGAADSQVNVDDGNGGKLAFKGYLTAPALEHSEDASSETVSVVGQDAIIGILNLSMYLTSPTTLRGEVPNSILPTPIAEDGNLSNLILRISDAIVNNYQETYNKTLSQPSKDYLEIKHTINNIALPGWRQILRNNALVHASWADTLKTYPNVGVQLSERIKALLQQQSANFWDVVNALGAELLFFYRPNVDGSFGAVVSAADKVDDELAIDSADTISDGFVRYSGTDGNRAMLPLTGVVVKGVKLEALRAEVDALPNIVGQWPLQLSTGFVQEIAAPAWLVTGAGNAFLPFATRTTYEKLAVRPPKKRFNLINYRDRRTQTIKKIEIDGSNSLTTMLQSIAKLTYDDMRLMDSVVSLSVPLNFSVKIGVRYKFHVEDGGSFNGFVNAVRHSLQLQNGNQLSSGTVLNLSHITYEK